MKETISTFNAMAVTGLSMGIGAVCGFTSVSFSEEVEIEYTAENTGSKTVTLTKSAPAFIPGSNGKNGKSMFFAGKVNLVQSPDKIWHRQDATITSIETNETYFIQFYEGNVISCELISLETAANA